MRHRAEWTAFVEQREREAGRPLVAAPPPARITAQGRPRVEKMNKTEAAYEAHLNLRKITGEVIWFAFEGMTFKLGPDVRLTPDFMVMLSDGTLEAHDTKGTTTRKRKDGTRDKVAYCMDDARIKMAVAARLFPIVFKTVHFADGNWVERIF